MKRKLISDDSSVFNSFIFTVLKEKANSLSKLKSVTNGNFNRLKSFMAVGVLCFSTAGIVNAQDNVGISSTGDAPKSSAMLDISSSDKGLLIPNVDLVSTTNNTEPVFSPEISLLVYNKASSGDVTPGYYYWDGAAWVRLGRTLVTLGADVLSASSSTSFQDILGLSFGMVSGVNYRFQATIWYTASVTTHGMRLSMNCTAAPTSLAYMTNVMNGPAGTGILVSNNQFTRNAGTTSTSSPATAGNLAIIHGFIKAGADDIFILRFAPGASIPTIGAITIKAGSTLEIW